MSKRHVIIGDVHGCRDEHRELLRLLDPRRGDWIAYVGDLVDRGPDALGVLRDVLALRARGQSGGFEVEVVEGNHEIKLRRYRRQVRMATEQEKPPPPLHHNVAKLINALTLEEQSFLDEMPWYLRPNDEFLVVHAGVSPSITFLPPMEDIRTYSGNKRAKYDGLAYTRWIKPDGHRSKSFKRQPGDSHWADLYDGRFGHVYFGHQPYKQPEPREWDYATGLDLGCVFGGWLAAVVIEGDDRILVTVKAKMAYSDNYIDQEAG